MSGGGTGPRVTGAGSAESSSAESSGAAADARADLGDAALDAAFRATWPSAETAVIGGLTVGRGMGGGGRVGSARTTGHWRDADIDAAIAQQRAWGEPPLFSVADGDGALHDALARRGWRFHTPTVVMLAPVAALTDQPLRPVTAFALWPPLAIQRELWDDCDIGPARQAVIARAPQPKAALLGRISDRAAGIGFVAVSGQFGFVHALAVLPAFRGKGLAGWMMRKAALFAADHGADYLALAVTRDNPAVALYQRLGFGIVARYCYASPPEPGVQA